MYYCRAQSHRKHFGNHGMYTKNGDSLNLKLDDINENKMSQIDNQSISDTHGAGADLSSLC